MSARTPSTVASSSSLRTLWLGAGWIGVVVVTYFTLAPNPPQIDLEQGDKLQHLVAYASLMLWFSQVQTGVAERRITALLLVALGIALEFAQGLTGYRFMSAADMAANMAGVALGWLAAPPRLPNAFAWGSTLLGRGR
jgi:VanZ family protein